MDSAHEPVAMEMNPSYTIVSLERSLKNQIKEMKETKLVNIHTLYSGPEAIVTIILIFFFSQTSQLHKSHYISGIIALDIVKYFYIYIIQVVKVMQSDKR